MCALQLPVHPSIGAKATLVIQPDFGYGDRGAGKIPGGATLNFGEKEHLYVCMFVLPPLAYFEYFWVCITDVEVLDIVSPPNVFETVRNL